MSQQQSVAHVIPCDPFHSCYATYFHSIAYDEMMEAVMTPIFGYRLAAVVSVSPYASL